MDPHITIPTSAMALAVSSRPFMQFYASRFITKITGSQFKHLVPRMLTVRFQIMKPALQLLLAVFINVFYHLSFHSVADFLCVLALSVLLFCFFLVSVALWDYFMKSALQIKWTIIIIIIGWESNTPTLLGSPQRHPHYGTQRLTRRGNCSFETLHGGLGKGAWWQRCQYILWGESS